MNLFSVPDHLWHRRFLPYLSMGCSALLLACTLSSVALAQDPDEDAGPISIGIADPNAGALGPAMTNSGPADIQRIDFNRDNGSVGRLTVKFDSPGAVASVRSQGNRVVIDLDNVTLPTQWSRPLNVANFNTPVQRVEARPSAYGAQLVLTTNREIDEPTIYQTDDEYTVEIKPRSENPNGPPTAASVARAASTVAERGYTGTPITFNFQDVPVRTVLQLLAEESKLNLVAADNVAGNVTLRLDNVPWDQALDIVLRSKGLDKRRDGNVIWVAPQQELANYERSIEDARIDLENRVDLVTDYIQINYHNADNIREVITAARGIGGGGGVDNRDNGFMSPRGMLVSDMRTNTLMVSDIPKKVEQMRGLISIIDKPIDQVLIESRIVVANDNFARELGISYGVRDTRSPVITPTPGDPNTNRGFININTPAASNPMITIGHTILRNDFSLTQILNAMQQEGRGEIVSNPRIVTANQREALIQQGREVGYVTITGGGTGAAATPNVEFKDVLLELRVTPTIAPDGRVFLDMNIKKDDLVDMQTLEGYGDVPVISRREINTAVLVEDGQTVVIGGVYEFSDLSSVNKVPLLADIPFLGHLFKSRSRSRNKAEMLVFVTPKVMRVRAN